MKPGYRIYGNDNLDLSASDVKLRATPKIDMGRKCFECSSSKQLVHLSYVDLIDCNENGKNNNYF